ncbi:MAG: glycosyltransferase family 4 protein [Acidobacteriia bacterium]|nr:glycosyltransferase family 4 protein [Terriglobia bacterium]
MRLLMISPCPYDRLHGGVQVSGQLAWEGIISSTLFEKARLLCYGRTCDVPDSAGFDRSLLSCNRSKLRVIKSAFLLRDPADIILFWHVRMLKLLPFLRPGKVRVALFVHGIECWDRLTGIVGHQLAKVDTVFCASQFSLEKFVRANPGFRPAVTRVVHLGMDAEDSSPAPPEPPPAALIVGRMVISEDYKGHRQLINVWPQVLERTPGAELWIAGTGDLEPELRSLASSRAGKSIRFYGPVSQETKLDLLRRCRCFAMPSPNEGFGLVYLEAMRVGRPCLVHSNGAGKEVIGSAEAGLAVNADNPGELAAALSRLLRPGEEWDRWSCRARELYNSSYTARHFQNRLMNALEESASR